MIPCGLVKIFVKLFFVILCFIAPLAFSLWSLPAIPLSEILANETSTNTEVFWNFRLTRFVLAFLTGASLALAGVSFQSLLRNPLADPYILGVSGGSAIAYVLGILFGLPTLALPVAGFAGALLSLLIIYSLSKTRGQLLSIHLLLTGVIFNSFSFATILILNNIVPFGQSQQILALLIGSIPPHHWSTILFFLPLTMICASYLWWKSSVLNLMSLGEEEAFHLGVATEREKALLFIITSLLVGASVSLCGLIGFVGLFVPHLLRLVVGANHKVLVPASFLFGGFFLTAAEFIASHLMFWDTLQTKLPVGAITALIGAPVFVILLKRQTRKVLC